MALFLLCCILSKYNTSEGIWYASKVVAILYPGWRFQVRVSDLTIDVLTEQRKQLYDNTRSMLVVVPSQVYPTAPPLNEYVLPREKCLGEEFFQEHKREREGLHCLGKHSDE